MSEQFKRPLPSFDGGAPFELTSIRWRYFIRSENPSEQKIKEYEELVKTLCSSYFKKNKQMFLYAGIELDDLINIARIQVVSYLGCFSINSNPEIRERFTKRFIENNGRVPEQADYELVDRKYFNNFLTQRLSDLKNFTPYKIRGMTGSAIKAKYFKGPSSIMPTDTQLLSNPKAVGYEKAFKKEVMALIKSLKLPQAVESFVVENTRYKKVEVSQGLYSDDAQDKYVLTFFQNTDFLKSPLEMLEKKREVEYFDNLDKKKERKLKNFIAKNKNVRKMKEHVLLARDILKKKKKQ